MLELDKFLSATPKELENLPWYEITSKLGLLSFNALGKKPIELIANLTQILEASNVLMVGCGAGGTAVQLAEMTGSTVYGVDIAPEAIRVANENAAKSTAHNKLHFSIGDAGALDFAPNMFDVVITEFMAFFLEPQAFEGFLRVLKPGGIVTLAELMKDPGVTAEADEQILTVEKDYSELLGYKFHIPLTTEYLDWLTRAGFTQVEIKEHFSQPSFRELLKAVGGWKPLFKIIRVMLRLMRGSPILKKKFLIVGRMKRVLYKRRSTAKYISQVVMIGRKS